MTAGRLANYLPTFARCSLHISLPTPKVSEIPKPFDYRAFYIGTLGCVQLFRRPDISQRSVAMYDHHATFGESQCRIGQKVRRIMRFEHRCQEPRAGGGTEHTSRHQEVFQQIISGGRCSDSFPLSRLKSWRRRA